MISQTIRSEPVILWTGATGFFGKALLRTLAVPSTGNVVPATWHFLSRDPERFSSLWPELATTPGSVWHRGDILSLAPLGPSELSHVVHAAADSTDGVSLAHSTRFDQIVEGTRRVLDLAVRQGAKRFLLTSSGAVYGRQPKDMERIPEDYLGMPDPLIPGHAYGVAKRAAEHLCAIYAAEHGIEIVIARCFAFVGEDLPLDVHFAIGNFIRDALWSDEIVVNGDGTPLRSYLDQRDLIRWLLALLHEGKSGEAYNVGSDCAISIGELAHLVRDLVSPGKPVRILCTAAGSTTQNRYVPDVSKIARDLSLSPSVPLEQAILDAASAASRSKMNPSLLVTRPVLGSD